MSESFTQGPYPGVLKSYAYQQYSWSSDIQAFFTSLNTILQGYLTWFYETPLSVYTAPGISGPLLDWTATGIYGIARPVLGTETTVSSGPLGTNLLGTHTFGVLSITNSGTTATVTDDIYKRTMTWILYRGDGLRFCIPWLLRRVERFLGGVNGADVPLDLATRPTVTVSGAAFTVTVPSANPASVILQQLVAQGFLPFPAPYTFTVTVV